MKPVYGLGPLLLIILGIVRLTTTNYTARSYIITAWALLLLPILIINPSYVSITFVPAMLLMAMGVNALLGSWYGLFPQNPYARIAGLIPLTILVGGMVISGAGRYAYGYTYDPNTAGHFSHDLRLISTQLDDNSTSTATTLVVTKDQEAFYAIVASQHTNVTVATSSPKPQTPLMIFSHDAYRTSTPSKLTPQRIITDNSSTHSDRFYVYKGNQ